MAYKMTLNMGSNKYDVLASSFQFVRDVDMKGRPSSGVYGGTINLTVESYEDTTLLELMLMKQHTAQEGDITFEQGSSDGEMKKLAFKDGFITSYSESASAGGGDAMTISISISAREISMGDKAKHVNLWPASKA